MSQSVWSAGKNLPQFETLHGSVRTDVLIIGGGLCGILCAYFLRMAGVETTLVEGNTICSGISKNTTAKITSLHGLPYHKMIKSVGKEMASMYLWANERALGKYHELAQTIDCDFEEKSAFTYSVLDRRKIEEEVHAVNLLGFPAVFAEHLPLPFETKGAVEFQNQAQFHPLKFIAGMLEGLKIYEHTFIRDLAQGVGRGRGDRCG